MAERIVSMHAAYKSGKEVVDGFLSRPTERGSRTAIVLVHGYRGLDDGQKAVTRRFAQEGFVCLRRKSRCFAKLSINTKKGMKSKCTLERGMLF